MIDQSNGRAITGDISNCLLISGELQSVLPLVIPLLNSTDRG